MDLLLNELQRRLEEAALRTAAPDLTSLRL